MVLDHCGTPECIANPLVKIAIFPLFHWRLQEDLVENASAAREVVLRDLEERILRTRARTVLFKDYLWQDTYFPLLGRVFWRISNSMNESLESDWKWRIEGRRLYGFRESIWRGIGDWSTQKPWFYRGEEPRLVRNF